MKNLKKKNPLATEIKNMSNWFWQRKRGYDWKWNTHRVFLKCEIWILENVFKQENKEEKIGQRTKKKNNK